MLQVVYHRRDPSILSSLLTTSMIYVPEVVQTNIAIFADDTNLYRPIITSDDNGILQGDLDLLVA